MEGLCHVEDLMREEIHFERGHFEAEHFEEICIIPFVEEHHYEAKHHHEHRDVDVGHHDYVSKRVKREHHDDVKVVVREVVEVIEHVDVDVREEHDK
jgi:hypothetical protein